MANRIKQLRKENGYSMSSLAKALVEQGFFSSISDASISNYENGKREPKLATWSKLADFFGCDIGYLQGYSDVKKIPDNFRTLQQDDTGKHFVSYDASGIADKNTSSGSLLEASFNKRLSDKATTILNTLYSDDAMFLEYNETISDTKDLIYYTAIMKAFSTAVNDLLKNNNDNSNELLSDLYSLSNYISTHNDVSPSFLFKNKEQWSE